MYKQEFITVGPWQKLIAITNVMCPDGRTRYATITGQPHFVGCLPGSVHFKGKTLSGRICNVADVWCIYPEGANAPLAPDVVYSADYNDASAANGYVPALKISPR